LAVELCAVVPCYNERQSLVVFIDEWLNELRRHGMPFTIHFMDGGSTDGTIEFLQDACKQHQEIKLHVEKGLRHGPSCLCGYRLAIDEAAEGWVLLLDSDGQCDPAYFAQFWQRRDKSKCVQGFRAARDDGLVRLGISRILTFVVFCLAGTFVRDLNVPYRLMPARTLRQLISVIPDDLDLANVLLSICYARAFGIIWVPISFRQRSFGVSVLNFKSMAKVAMDFIVAFQGLRPKLNAQLSSSRDCSERKV
jgi:glycosyltransferase involved in cell wall biosynthesis